LSYDRAVLAHGHHPGRHWHATEAGRIQCDVCPRFCTLNDGQRGMCFVRMREGDQIVLTTYGRSSGFCIDPIEKKPLNHFHPGSSVLSFGTAGCNLACKFCQNWDISKSRELDKLQIEADPEAIAAAAVEHGCKSVAFTYNDPVIFLEYAADTAKACRERGVETVAVTAGYITEQARPDLYEHITAANVDLKAFTEEFYHEVTASHLQPVLDTLEYLVKETEVWTEITTLLIPGLNDGDDEIAREADWILEKLGPDVPLHFSAYHPDYKMTRPATPPSTLRRARQIAKKAGLHHVYTGNVHDLEGGLTSCAACGSRLIARDWYEILEYRVTSGGRCSDCGAAVAGRFSSRAGAWGRKRMRVVP
jgi:pyruvate formate lyase activating enzyme